VSVLAVVKDCAGRKAVSKVASSATALRAAGEAVRCRLPDIAGDEAALKRALEASDGAACLAMLAQPTFAGVSAKFARTALMYAAQMRLAEVCQAILSRADFVEVNAKTDSGRTALHSAASRGLAEVCQAMLSRADFVEVNAKNASGMTALHYAAAGGYAEVCQAILSRAGFVEVNAKHIGGMTALGMAEGNGHAAVAALLRGR
jgi:uncharacterized protein YjbI with pentapeptide repeats